MNSVSINDSEMYSAEYHGNKRPEMVDFIPEKAKKILEIGCSSGLFGAEVKKKRDCEFWGVELDRSFAVKAEDHIDKLIIGDVLENLETLPEDYFDCIVLNDVLEHFVEPAYFLSQITKRCLKKDGCVVTSIPNVRHIRVIFEFIFLKDWKYRSSGILDQTHLRFFTKKSIPRLFQKCNMQVDSITGINKSKLAPFIFILNILSFGLLSDIQYTQFACIASVKK